MTMTAEELQCSPSEIEVAELLAAMKPGHEMTNAARNVLRRLIFDRKHLQRELAERDERIEFIKITANGRCSFDASATVED